VVRRCPTQKRIFTTSVDAMIALMNTRKRDRDEGRYYKCPSCSGYHLTSKR
jgi:hypothetical protein